MDQLLLTILLYNNNNSNSRPNNIRVLKTYYTHNSPFRGELWRKKAREESRQRAPVTTIYVEFGDQVKGMKGEGAGHG